MAFVADTFSPFEETRVKARTAILEQAQQDAKLAEARAHALTDRVDNLDLGELSNSLVKYDTPKREEQGLVDQLRQIKQQLENVMALQASASAAEIRWHPYPRLLRCGDGLFCPTSATKAGRAS
jgi:hypothetical protein